MQRVTITLPNGIKIDCEPSQVKKILKDYNNPQTIIPQPQFPVWPSPGIPKIPDYSYPPDFYWWDKIYC